MNSDFFDFEYTERKTSNAYILSVSQLNEYAESLIACDKLLARLSVEGEISGFKRYYQSGHCYFTLKDANASLRCVMFKGYASAMTFTPKDGMRVVLTGHAGLYTRDGQFQFYAEKMHSVGEGELYAKFLMLKEKLQAEGLFDDEYKKDLPKLPRCIGVVTSRSGAVLHDIKNVTKRRFPNMNIVLTPCSVQGKEAPQEIIKALEQLDRSGLADVIILGRGGGSMEDLWCFNDEGLARAVFACKTPVISAVGHETDFTIVDFVADMRAPTPSAAAELAVPLFDELLERVQAPVCEMQKMIETALKRWHEQLSIYENAIITPKQALSMSEIRFSQMQERVHEIVSARLKEAEARLCSMLDTADALSPTSVLKRGYARVSDENGDCIVSAKQLRQRNSAKITFHDGEVDVDVAKNV